jgi:hypothetical protein
MDTTIPSRGPWQYSLRALLGLVLVVALLFSTFKTYLWWQYPYGGSHCCDTLLLLELSNYARDHAGRYPRGEATPEASLSLLYPKYSDANILRGKTVPLGVVAAILERGERLGPETCGWHYVEGLTVKDDRRIAIFWDKIGLGHNGQRLSQGGHFVAFLSGSIECIPGAEWDKFIEEQKRLLLQRAADNKPQQRGSAPPNQPGG